MITFSSKGDFKRSKRYFNELIHTIDNSIFEYYGQKGVDALMLATPIDTGITAVSWRYEIKRTTNRIELIFSNDNVVNGVNIAVILQYGHATRNGGWVEGVDYINPAIQPILILW